MRKNIFTCLFNVHNTIRSSRHGQVCLMRLRFDRYFSHHRSYDRRGITRNIASLKTLVHDVINLLHYRYFMTQDREVVSPCVTSYINSEVAFQKCYIIITSEVELVKLDNEYLHNFTNTALHHGLVPGTPQIF